MDRWSRDQGQPGSLFQRLREAEKRDPGNEVDTECSILQLRDRESKHVKRLLQKVKVVSRGFDRPQQ